MLYFDLRPSPKCHLRWCTERKWHIPMAVRRGNRVGGNWLTKWDKLKKSHDTLIDWRTGREWPLNCMTVISAWWRLNMRFQRSSGRLYNSVEFESQWQLQKSWRRSWRRDVVGKATPGQGGPREPRWSLGTREVADKMQ